MLQTLEKPKILCEVGTSRSGSKFFHSLLDGHPQVMCFPRTLQFNSFWESLKKQGDIQYIVDAFVEKYKRFFSGEFWDKSDRVDQLGPDRNETFNVDIIAFRKNVLTELKELSRPGVFVALHRAYHLACGKKIPDKPLILYHIHNLDLVDEFKACVSDFPDTYLIVMIRHPIEEINSIIAWMKRHNTLNCGGVFHLHKQALRCVTHIDFPEIRILPFEQLMRRHKESMEALVGWLKINWDDNLMTSTIHGKIWWGNGRKAHNTSDSNWKTYQPLGFWERKDWKVFCSLAFERMKSFGYPVERGSRLLILLPTAFELATFKYYLVNPLKWFYYYLRRVIYYCQFAIRPTEKLPKLLINKESDAKA